MMQKRRRRPKRSAAQWAELIAAWRDSGLSGRRFAAEHDLGVASLYRWAQKLEPQTRPRRSRESFVAVQVVEQSSRAVADKPGQMELVAHGGRLIRLTAPVDAEALATVLQVVERC
jgi:transposase-like protein